ncbi:lytic transglycosylase domain-containing protein [Acidithiobacillus caldus]|nr:lytic transglycosylase domain-containing protein [Acidithiobacillus caldus]
MSVHVLHPKAALIAVVAALFSLHSYAPPPPKNTLQACFGASDHALSVTGSYRQKHLKKLAGPYAHLVRVAAQKAKVPAKLVAAVVYVENGGNFAGSAHRVSSAGAIGVMQLMPTTAWDVLRVDPWNAQENIEGGARYLAHLLNRFHGNVRRALMAYNAGPSCIAQGYRPQAAVQYAQRVLALVEDI